MRKLIQTIAFTLLATVALHAQDTVFRKDGKIIPCKIQGKDSTKVTFLIKRNGLKILTYLNKEEVDSIKYGIIQEPIPFDKASIGPGLGLDYGGIGLNFTLYPQQNIGLFAGFGYAIAGLGYNVGAKYRHIPSNTATVLPYLIAMYSYNTAIQVKNANGFNKHFYGTTVGVGLELHSKSISRGYWTMAMLVPIRDSEVEKYIDKPWPVTFSIGYRLILD